MSPCEKRNLKIILRAEGRFPDQLSIPWKSHRGVQIRHWRSSSASQTHKCFPMAPLIFRFRARIPVSTFGSPDAQDNGRPSRVGRQPQRAGPLSLVGPEDLKRDNLRILHCKNQDHSRWFPINNSVRCCQWRWWDQPIKNNKLGVIQCHVERIIASPFETDRHKIQMPFALHRWSQRAFFCRPCSPVFIDKKLILFRKGIRSINPSFTKMKFVLLEII